ncbi:hypothetical protein ADK51_00820 [Streptomyces sp. WM6368]|nr:hypothetical protein ADK51_00820 [Streptomyces sp. WM6368]
MPAVRWRPLEADGGVDVVGEPALVLLGGELMDQLSSLRGLPRPDHASKSDLLGVQEQRLVLRLVR